LRFRRAPLFIRGGWRNVHGIFLHKVTKPTSKLASRCTELGSAPPNNLGYISSFLHMKFGPERSQKWRGHAPGATAPFRPPFSLFWVLLGFWNA
jgi:hypothetical protein